jgi:hypothetical protein
MPCQQNALARLACRLGNNLKIDVVMWLPAAPAPHEATCRMNEAGFGVVIVDTAA